jgi:regulator of cell morphogenesis and NO signaling
MNAIYVHQTVGALTARNPCLSSALETLGIDYCCGGKKTLAEACHEKGLDLRSVLRRLQEQAAAENESESAADVMSMSLTELVDHIEKTHHAYLREELPRLAGMIQTVASTHGERDPRLHQAQEAFGAMALELSRHMFKEEECLFPMIRQLEASSRPPSFHCGTLANPIRQMESEHDDAGSGLERLRELTDGFTPPEWACKTYRALLAGLAFLERDLHLHIHKENNVLFPSALEMEAVRQRGLPVASSARSRLESTVGQRLA